MIHGLFILLALAVAAVPARGGRIAALTYGASPGGVGLKDAPGAERQGPRSFAVDTAGRVYICDTVNARVLVVSPGGGTEAQFPVEGFVTDIAADGEDGVLVLDEEASALRRYDLKGAPRGSIPVSPALVEEKEVMAVRDGRVCLRSRDHEEYAVAALERGVLRKAAPEARAPRGAGGSGGLFYDVRKDSRERAGVTVRDGGGRIVRAFGLAIPRLASVAFLGADGGGNACLQVEQIRTDGIGVSLGVLRVGPDGGILARIDDIPNDYACWTARLLFADSHGDIYQVLPARDRVHVNRWRWNTSDAADLRDEGGEP
jgi:hypothetical protein